MALVFTRPFLICICLISMATWAKPESYEILEEDSDYADAVSNGPKTGAELKFSTCSCELPAMSENENGSQMLCYTVIGHHQIYIEGPREHRKLLARHKTSLDKSALIVVGKVTNTMQRYWVDYATGTKTIKDTFPIIRSRDVYKADFRCK